MGISVLSEPCVPLQAWGIMGAISLRLPPFAFYFFFTLHPHKHMHTLKRRGCFCLASKDRNHTQTQKKLGEYTAESGPHF